LTAVLNVKLGETVKRSKISLKKGILGFQDWYCMVSENSVKGGRPGSDLQTKADAYANKNFPSCKLPLSDPALNRSSTQTQQVAQTSYGLKVNRQSLFTKTIRSTNTN